MAIELKYVLREEEFREGMAAGEKSVYSEGQKTFWGMVVMGMMAGAGIATGVLAHPLLGNVYVEIGCGVGVFIFLIWVLFALRNNAWRSVWKERLRGELALMLEEEQVIWETGGNSLRVPWSNVKGWMNMRRVMVIRTTAGVIVVSKREMSAERVGEVGGFLGRNMAGVRVPPVAIKN